MNYIFTLFILLFLSGCINANPTTHSNNQLDEHLNVGTTNKISLEKLLGEPESRDVATSGYECWYYSPTTPQRKDSKVKMMFLSTNAVSYIPNKTFEKDYGLKVFIDPRGILMDYEYQ